MTVDPNRLADKVKAGALNMGSTIKAAAASQQLPTRGHVHKLVDQLLDAGQTVAEMTQAVHVPVREAMRQSARAASPRSAGRGGGSDAARLGALQFGPLAPGDSATAELTVGNEGTAIVEGLELSCAVLVTATGARIPGSAVAVTPKVLDLHPRSSRIVDVQIAVPAGVTAGTYTGVLESAANRGIQTVVQVEVS